MFDIEKTLLMAIVTVACQACFGEGVYAREGIVKAPTHGESPRLAPVEGAQVSFLLNNVGPSWQCPAEASKWAVNTNKDGVFRINEFFGVSLLKKPLAAFCIYHPLYETWTIQEPLDTPGPLPPLQVVLKPKKTVPVPAIP